MDVIILDSHIEEDARIKRHVEHLIDQGLSVYRIHYNYIDKYAQPGVFSEFGEKGFRINVLMGKLRTPYFLIYCLRRKILAECLRALEILNYDPEQPSVIHVHDPWLLPLAGMLVRNDLSDSKIVYDRHELYDKLARYLGVSLPGLYEKLTKNSISGVVIVSEHHASMTHKLFITPHVVAVPNYPISTIYNNNIVNNKIQSLRSDSRINAIYIGSLNQSDRDVDLLIKIADTVLQSYNNVNFIVGGTNLDSQSKVKIDALSKKHDGRFQLLGYVPREKAVEFTQKAHVGFLLVRPDTHYWVKTSPNKVFEYLMCGTVPIIRADVDHADVLRRCSLIFDRFDGDDVIVKAVSDLIGDHVRLKELMTAAKDLSADYTWEGVAFRYIELYKLLLYPDTALKI